MANLYSDSNFYISDVTYHGGDTPSYNVIFTYTSNSVSSEFTVGADLLVTNAYCVGGVWSLGQSSSPRDQYALNNAFTTSATSVKSTSNTGSGMTASIQVHANGYADYTVSNKGTGYYVSDEVVFDKDAFHRSELILGKDEDVTLVIQTDDRVAYNYFPVGLSNASVVSNVVPLMNTHFGF